LEAERDEVDTALDTSTSKLEDATEQSIEADQLSEDVKDQIALSVAEMDAVDADDDMDPLLFETEEDLDSADANEAADEAADNSHDSDKDQAFDETIYGITR